MAVNRQLVGAINDELTRSELIPVLQAESAALSNLQGISGEYARGAAVQSSLITPPTTAAYTGADITRANAADTAKTIAVTEGSSFNEFINIGALSTTPVPQLAQKFAEVGMGAVATDIDTYVLAQAAAGAGTSGTTAAISSSNIETVLDEGIEALMDNHVKMRDVAIFLPSYAYILATKVYGTATESGVSALANGTTFGYNGARFVYSPNLDAGVGAGSVDMIFSATWATAYVIGAMESDIYVPENNFGAAFKGVAIYGADVLEPNAVVKTEVTKA